MPRLRLGLFYFMFFAAVGAFMPYWSLYLESLGFSAGDIGLTLGLMMATRIVTPNLWAWLGDRHVKRIHLIHAGSTGALLVFAFIPSLESVRALILAGVLYSVLWSAVLPQFEVITLNHLHAGSANYSRIRLWGSVGFVVASAVIGLLLERHGPALLPWLMLILIALVVAVGTLIAEAPADPIGVGHHASVLSILRKPQVLALLLACFLMQASHGPYYVFFSIQLQFLGFGRDGIGALWALAVIAEVVMLAAMPKLIRRVPLRDLFVCCFLLTAVRWGLMALAVSLWVLILAQCLHAVSFGAYHAVAIQLIHRHFTGQNQGRGQALYASLSFGAGGAVGSFISGWIWDPSQAWLSWSLAAATATLGAVIAWRGLDRN